MCQPVLVLSHSTHNFKSQLKLPSMWCSNQLHLITFTNVHCSMSLTVAKEGHSILPSQHFPASCFQSEHFPIWTFSIWVFPIWTFPIWVFPKSEIKKLNISNLKISNLDMICYSPVQRVWSLQSTEIVNCYEWPGLLVMKNEWPPHLHANWVSSWWETINLLCLALLISQLMSAGTRIWYSWLHFSIVFKGCNMETAAFEWSDPTGKELFMQSAVVQCINNTRCVWVCSLKQL